MGTTLQKVTTARTLVAADSSARKRINNKGPSTVFYGGPDVSLSVNDGEIVVDQALDVEQAYWYVSVNARLLIEDVAPSESPIDIPPAGVSSFNGRQGDITLQLEDVPGIAMGAGVIIHGENADTPRSGFYNCILWFGTAQPTNAQTTDVWIDTDASPIIRADGSLKLTEMSDPTAPVAGNVKIYSRDNGSGKTQVVARFPTGAVQVIATEP